MNASAQELSSATNIADSTITNPLSQLATSASFKMLQQNTELMSGHSGVSKVSALMEYIAMEDAGVEMEGALSFSGMYSMPLKHHWAGTCMTSCSVQPLAMSLTHHCMYH